MTLDQIAELCEGEGRRKLVARCREVLELYGPDAQLDIRVAPDYEPFAPRDKTLPLPGAFRFQASDVLAALEDTE